jgi:hypothetical protein
MALAARRQLAAAFVLLERIRSAGAHRARRWPTVEAMIARSFPLFKDSKTL